MRRAAGGPQSRFGLSVQARCRSIPAMTRTKRVFMVVTLLAIAVDGLASKPREAIHEMSRGRGIDAITLLFAVLPSRLQNGIPKR